MQLGFVVMKNITITTEGKLNWIRVIFEDEW